MTQVTLPRVQFPVLILIWKVLHAETAKIPACICREFMDFFYWEGVGAAVISDFMIEDKINTKRALDVDHDAKSIY